MPYTCTAKIWRMEKIGKNDLNPEIHYFNITNAINASKLVYGLHPFLYILYFL